MTRLEARTLALRAAAKVAFSVSIVGCSAGANDVTGLTTDTPSDDTESSSYASSSSSAIKRSCRDAGPAPVCGLTAGKPFDAPALTCCTAHIKVDEPLWAEDADGGFIAPTGTTAEHTCCQALIKAVNTRWDDFSEDAGPTFAQTIDWTLIQRCCGLEGNPSGIACTPWGPPVPPEMIEFAEWLEVA